MPNVVERVLPLDGNDKPYVALVRTVEGPMSPAEPTKEDVADWSESASVSVFRNPSLSEVEFSSGGESDGKQSKLVLSGFFGFGGCERSCEFELKMLRELAEMAGKGSLETVYRAMLEDGRVLADRHLRDTNLCPSKDFNSLRHPNLAYLLAFYFAEQEILLIHDFVPNGTLHSCIHANCGPGKVPLDWTSKFKLLLEAARGLAWIHREYSVSSIPHGNIKSCNILIRQNHETCITDLGMSLLLSPAHAIARLGDYMAPEQAHSNRLSQVADVYSFGVLFLEVLTGRVPTQCLPPLPDSTSQKKRNKSVGVAGVDVSDVGLVEWVRLVMREDGTAEVFDLELLRYRDIEGEIVSMLHAGLVCVNQLLENRPNISKVVKLIEGIRAEDQSPLSPSIATI